MLFRSNGAGQGGFWNLYLTNNNTPVRTYAYLDVKYSASNYIDPNFVYTMQCQLYYTYASDSTTQGTSYLNTDNIYLQSYLPGNGTGDIELTMYYLRLNF